MGTVSNRLTLLLRKTGFYTHRNVHSFRRIVDHFLGWKRQTRGIYIIKRGAEGISTISCDFGGRQSDNKKGLRLSKRV